MTAISTPNDMVTLVGIVDRTTYASADGSYTVSRVKVEGKIDEVPAILLNKKGEVTVAGAVRMPLGELVELTGKIFKHHFYGHQLQVETYRVIRAVESNQIISILCKRVKDVNKVVATKIVERFGTDTFRIIEQEPDRLLEIPLIGKKRLASIVESWGSIEQDRKMMAFYSKIGLADRFHSLCKTEFGDNAEQIITADPYVLARKIKGIGWQTADEVAMKMGIQELSNVRLRAAAYHTLDNELSDGHCFVSFGDVCNKTVTHLKSPMVSYQMVAAAVEEAITLDIIKREIDRLYMPHIFRLEELAARRLARIVCSHMPSGFTQQKLTQVFLDVTSKSKVPLDQTQMMAVWGCLNSKASVITGLPGTGKTTVTRTVVEAFKKMGLPITAGAPTGKASRRITEVVGIDAATMHSMYHKAKGTGGIYDGVIILDESSMIDISIFQAFLSVVSEDAIIVFVGDIKQLPSVGPGAVLRDIINSGVIFTVTLTEIHRAAAESDIILNAHSIDKGYLAKPNVVVGSYIPKSDFVLFNIEDDNQQLQTVAWLMQHYIPYLGYNPARDVQIMSPGHKGLVGVSNLNQTIQSIINPNPPDSFCPFKDVKWGVGDRLMNFANTDKLSNGDIGILSGIDREGENVVGMSIIVDDRPIRVDRNCFKDFHLANASTIHKMQGSECPCTIIILHTTHFMLLDRSLFFTAETRTRKQCFVIASPRALERALSHTESRHRNTRLAFKLQDYVRELQQGGTQ